MDLTLNNRDLEIWVIGHILHHLRDNINNNNIYFAKGQVHQKGKRPL